MRMGSQDRPNREYIQGIKCQSLCNNNKIKQSAKPIVE